MSYNKRMFSTDTIFHYTRSMSSLLGILKEGFIPYYCLEDYHYLSQSLGKIALPMVSFCDIPLNRAITPMNKYGYYAIGMKKEWAIRNRISPLVYSIDQSSHVKSLRYIFGKGAKLQANTVDLQKYRIKMRLLISFMKPYEGTLHRKNREIENYRFYDEREWRFVPDNSTLDYEVYTEKGYIEKRNKTGSKLRCSENLIFTPNDINYIIIKKESELLKMYEKVIGIKSHYSSNELKILGTRLISAEHILEDF